MAASETRTVTYLPPGVGVTAERDEPTLDPALKAIRDDEVKANDAVEIDTAPREPSIDPELVKARDEQIRVENERAGVKPAAKPEPAAKRTSSARSTK